MDTQKLEKIGLTRNESIVYTCLLRLGTAPAQALVKESELHRSRVYDALESLQRKGLAGFVVKDYKKYFQAVAPEKLLSYIEEQKETVEELLPELNKLQGQKREEISGSVYRGKEGLKSIYSLMLKESGDVLVLGAKGHIFSELKYYLPSFERERLKKKMKWVCLWDTEQAMENRKKDLLVSGKTLPKGFDSKAVVQVFGDKVAIVSWEEKYPAAFLIENKNIADSFRKWFNLIMKYC